MNDVRRSRALGPAILLSVIMLAVLGCSKSEDAAPPGTTAVEATTTAVTVSTPRDLAPDGCSPESLGVAVGAWGSAVVHRPSSRTVGSLRSPWTL